LQKYLDEDTNIQVIKELAEVGVKFNNFEGNWQSIGRFKEDKRLRFSITGKFDIPRSQIVKMLEKRGLIWDDQPTKETDFILVGQNP